MDIHVLDALARGGFEEIVAFTDRNSGLRAFLAIHDTSEGPAFGGIRRLTYRTENEALRDVLRLSRAMTHKCVLLGLPCGGGKMVLLDDPQVDPATAYRYVGEVVERMGGRYYTGPDVGTGAQELGWTAERTRFVTQPGEEGPGLLAEATAEGVFAGIGASLRHVDGEADWSARKVVIQGLGSVGSRLAKRLVEAGAHVVGTDVDPECAEKVGRALGIEIVDASMEYDLPCDVFAPCALGGILHDLSIPRLLCRIVAGGANNILTKPIHGDLLHDRGILYAPDFVINGGALVRGSTFHLEGRREPIEAIGKRIGSSLEHVLMAARDENRPPARYAFDEAEKRIEERRKPRDPNPS
jgi:leucine dehydrogenase